MKSCRFCHQERLCLLFKANKTRKNRAAAAFACTNCGFGAHGKIVRCQNCDMVYVDENISQKQISTYYEVAKDPLYFAEQPARQLTFTGYLEKLEKFFPRHGKLLDIGTNTGLFVKLARKHHWKADGIEPNIWAVEYAKANYQIKLINRPFEKRSFPENSFDVITMWDVIEHFTDPVGVLKSIYYQLKPGGMLAFSTVNPDSLLAKVWGTNWSWYMEMHRAFLTQKASRYYLQKIGFKRITFRPHWRYLSLGYLASRLTAVNPRVSNYLAKLINFLGLSKVVVPYYANDLFDCYAFKP